MCAKSCPTPCDPMNYSPPVPLGLGFSSKDTGVSCHFLLQETVVWSRLDWSGYWSGLPLLPLGDLPDSGIKPMSPKCLHSQKTIAEPQGKPPVDLGGGS